MIELIVKIVENERLISLRGKDIERMNTRAARKVQRAVQENFESLPGERFYKDAADATRVSESGATAMIYVEHRGVRLRWKGSGDLPGGVVKAGRGTSSYTGQPTRLLALPTAKRMEAPGRYEPLAFVRVSGLPHLKGLLKEGEERTAKRKYKGKPAGRAIIVPKANGQVMFRLVDETEHEPNPRVVPSEEVLSETARRDMSSMLRLLLRK